MWIARKILNKFLSFLFPVKCFICGQSEIILCEHCLKDFSRAVDAPFIWIQANYSFKDERVKKIIHSIKYYHRKDLIAPLVSSVVTKKFIEQMELFNDAILLPIPMSTLRHYTRGYNHAELLASEFSKQLNIPVYTNVLIKRESNKQQSKLRSRKDRLKNTQNTFEIVNKENILNKHIILIDDVTTTGSTLLSAHETLQKAGFKNISAICIAH